MAENLLVRSLNFAGRWVSALDGVLFGSANFSTLQNFRYKEGGIRSIGGMTKINSSALANPHIRSGIHFKKSQPSESHLLVQAYDINDANPKIYDNTTAVPGAGDFGGTPVYTDGVGAGTGRFAVASFGEVAYCNEIKACIWGGQEARCSQFINYDPSGLFKYDYSEVVTNTLSDAANCATFAPSSAGIDANTMLMLHLDNNVTDNSPTTPHTITNANVTFDATNKVFGSHAGSFNGTTSKLTAPDDADFDFSGGSFTIDGRCRTTSLSVSRAIFAQQTDANNYLVLFVAATGSVQFHIFSGGSSAVSLDTAAGVIAINTYYHIEVVEDGDEWYLFVDGILKAHTTSTNRAANYTGTIVIGANYTTAWWSGQIDEFRLSNIARHTGEFEPLSVAYSNSTAEMYSYLGSLRPLRGIKFYVQTANTNAGTARVDYWNGSEWVQTTNMTDGTSVAGKSLAQTGSMSFDDTQAVAKVKTIDQVVLYWYRIYISSLTVNTAVSYVTLDAAMQPIKDIWDGDLRTVLSCQIYKSGAYQENTVNVYSEDYSSSNAGSYAQFGGLLSASEHVVAGFVEQTMGLNVVLAGSFVNTNSSVLLSISYWNGAEWVSVGAIDDGTLSSGKSFAKSGIISWNSPAPSAEFKKEIAKEAGLYYYKMTFSANLSADVRVDFIGGIPAQQTIGGYKFPLFAGNRLMLCNNTERDKNAVLISARYASSVFNGSDSTVLYFGDDEGLTAGASLYSQFGSVLYALSVFCKANQTWILTGDGPSTWAMYQASDTIGCIAPETMKVAHVGFELVAGQSRYVAIWQGSEGIYLFDGKNIRPIHDDILDWFDKRNSYAINRNRINKSTAFFDNFSQEYHWCFSSGSNTTLDKEFVFDLKRMKWYEVVRGTGKALQFGIEAQDTLGSYYAYGAIDTGYAERLEYGNDFDGNAIVPTVSFGDFPLAQTPEGFISIETEIRRLKLMMVAKTVTVNNVTGTHYADTNSSGQSFTMAPQLANHRIAEPQVGESWTGILHRISLSMSTTNEAVGFEPLFMNIIYRKTRLDWQ